MYTISTNDDFWLSDCVELVNTAGFCIVENVLSKEMCLDGIKALESIKPLIQKEVGEERLVNAGEEGVFRAPMKFDPYFYKLLENKFVRNIADKIVSDTCILHLQNGFIFPTHDPKQRLDNFQYTFHPDFPRYLNGYMASLNILFTFSDANAEDEIFYIVPGTQQKEKRFSEDFCHRNKLAVQAKAGSVLVFDSTTWHCGGPNYSGKNWNGVNHQFTRSFIKQQLDYVRVLGETVVLRQKDRVQQMLGYYTRVVTCLDEYYQPEEKRLYRKGQG